MWRKVEVGKNDCGRGPSDSEFVDFVDFVGECLMIFFLIFLVESHVGNKSRVGKNSGREKIGVGFLV